MLDRLTALKSGSRVTEEQLREMTMKNVFFIPQSHSIFYEHLVQNIDFNGNLRSCDMILTIYLFGFF